MTPRYMVYDPRLTPYQQGVVFGMILAEKQHWAAKYSTPENICSGCGHTRDIHLDQPSLRGGTPENDRGWCTLPEGKCIHEHCECVWFEEPSDELIAATRAELDRLYPPTAPAEEAGA